LWSYPAVGKEALWIEGEDTTHRTSSDWIETWMAGPWYHDDKIMKDLLSPGKPGVSNGNWHSTFHTDPGHSFDDRTATYAFNIVEGGTYTWWIRLNPFRNEQGGANYSYRYKTRRGTWTSWKFLDVSEARRDMIDLVDPGIDIRFIAWCFGGVFNFAPGSHELQIRLSYRPDDEQNHGGIDVMAFTNFPWAPTGVIPPDPNPPAPQPDDWFTLMSGPDQFSEDSIIDMSHLIEKPAGAHGFLKAQGKDFVFEDGTPVKFWGVDAAMAETVEAQERQARFYAKHGINMVRQHPVESVLGTLQGGPANRRFDPVKLEKWDRWFSILKENGIYMTWSIFYHHVVLPDQGIDPHLYDELPSAGAGKDTYGFATYIEEYQDSQWRYASLLLNHVNPYTGLAYKSDPALAIVECRNEDSIFFHNPLGDGFVRGLDHPQHAARLKLMWQQWVKGRYRSNSVLAAAWGTGLKTGTIRNGDGSIRSRPDSVNETNMYIYAAWEMQADGPRWNKNKEKKRMGDFIRFLAEMQRDTYETYQQRLRSLGYQAVTVSTAWAAGGPAADAANLWTDDAMEAIDRHGYFGGGEGGHGITAGEVHNDTHLSRPGSGILSKGLWQVEDKPFIMTEWTQKPPNQYKAEMAPLFAFYGMGLQGWDASYHFAASGTYMGDGWPGMSSYVTCTPHYMGQFPALSFALYKGHLDEAGIAAARRLAVDEIFQGIDAFTQDSGGSGYGGSGNLVTPEEVLAIGRVTAKIADGQPRSDNDNWAAYWNHSAKTIESNTGQLTWDYGNKVVTVHSDKTQGVIGFAGGGTYHLPGATVTDVQTPFISLLFTPLDNLALIESEHILITAMARDKQYGTVYNADGTELIETGGPPLFLEPVQATITLKGSPVTSVRVIDIYGVPTDQHVERTDNTFRIDGRYATYYYQAKRSTECERANIDSIDDVEFADFALLAQAWLLTGTGLGGDINRDSAVDLRDLSALASHWLSHCPR
jgi:hypothetical protein